MTSLLQNTRRPDITFNKNGRIDITARVVRLLDIQPGDVIDVVTDGVEHYLRVQLKGSNLIGRHEGQCFPTKHGKKSVGSFRAWSRRLAAAVIKASGSDADTVRLPCGSIVEIDSRIYLPIIIRCVL